MVASANRATCLFLTPRSPRVSMPFHDAVNAG